MHFKIGDTVVEPSIGICEVQGIRVMNVDGQAVGLLSGMSRSNGGLPTWVKVVRDDGILLLDPKDVERLLGQ